MVHVINMTNAYIESKVEFHLIAMNFSCYEGNAWVSVSSTIWHRHCFTVCVRTFRGVGVVRCRVGSVYNVCYHGANMSFCPVLI